MFFGHILKLPLTRLHLQCHEKFFNTKAILSLSLVSAHMSRSFGPFPFGSPLRLAYLISKSDCYSEMTIHLLPLSRNPIALNFCCHLASPGCSRDASQPITPQGAKLIYHLEQSRAEGRGLQLKLRGFSWTPFIHLSGAS